MVDSCTASRPNGTEAQNEETGTTEPAYDELFTSACKIQERAVVALDSEVGSRTATTVRLELHLPISTDVLAALDVVEVTASADASLVGRAFTVAGPVGKTFGTARRYEVTEVVA